MKLTTDYTYTKWDKNKIKENNEKYHHIIAADILRTLICEHVAIAKTYITHNMHEV